MDAPVATRGLQSTAEVVARLERMPISPWHLKARAVVGVATFFDAYNALAIAYVLPVLIPLFHMAPQDIGTLISTGYLGQLIGALFFGARLGLLAFSGPSLDGGFKEFFEVFFGLPTSFSSSEIRRAN